MSKDEYFPVAVSINEYVVAALLPSLNGKKTKN